MITGLSPQRNLAQVARQVANDLHVNMKVAQIRLQNAKLSGLNLKKPGNLQKAISGDFTNCMFAYKRTEREATGHDLISHLRYRKLIR